MLTEVTGLNVPYINITTSHSAHCVFYTCPVQDHIIVQQLNSVQLKLPRIDIKGPGISSMDPVLAVSYVRC